jgi:toxin-antitoxin system PIN domain toxin
MRALLDVNVLLALFDSGHVHHVTASAWWTEHREDGWASSPFTQNGFVRVISNPRYARPVPIADAISLMRAQLLLPDHEFWPADISLADETIFDHSRILGPGQIADVYLLALAVRNKGRLVTFDRAIPLSAVRGAEARHLVVIA